MDDSKVKFLVFHNTHEYVEIPNLIEKKFIRYSSGKMDLILEKHGHMPEVLLCTERGWDICPIMPGTCCTEPERDPKKHRHTADTQTKPVSADGTCS